MNKYFIVKIF